jgi:uncharacterized membrane protein
MAYKPLSMKERFQFVRDIVTHEDNLTNFRTTWTLVFHGFLFTAFAAAAGLFEKLRFADPSSTPIHFGMLLVCLLGVISAVAAFFGLRAAERQLAITTRWWEEQLVKFPDDSYPPVFLHSKSKSKFGASAYFVVLAIVWVAFACLIIWSPHVLPPVK